MVADCFIDDCSAGVLVDVNVFSRQCFGVVFYTATGAKLCNVCSFLGSERTMNIVKGVADLLRRSSAGQTEELSTWQRVDKISAPTPKIRFR